MVARRVLLFMT